MRGGKFMRPASSFVLTPNEFRKHFPATGKRAYLNAAASSPLPTPARNAMVAFAEEVEAQGDAGFSKWLAGMDSVRAGLAHELNAKASDIAFTPSTSMGVFAAGALWKARGIDEVLAFSCEFPSTTVPLLKQGLAVKAVQPRADGSLHVADLDAACTPRTKAVAVSVVQFASGYRIDLVGLRDFCRSRGLSLLLNAAQALGQTVVDVEATGADFVCAPSHKWLCGGYGQGVMFVRALWRQETAWPPWAGWLSLQNALDMKAFPRTPLAMLDSAAALEAGCPAFGQLATFGASISLLAQLPREEGARHIRGLQTTLRTALRRRGFSPNCPDDDATLSGICVVPVDGKPEAAVAALYGRGVLTSARGGGVRISTHAYNDESDLTRLLTAWDDLGLKPLSANG